jgi:hypothetical protein
MKNAFATKSRGLFDPQSDKPLKVSRSGVEVSELQAERSKESEK